MSLAITAEKDVMDRRVRGKGSFALPLPPAVAFDLFTAEGECSWVKGWDPLFLGRGSGLEAGSVFLTDHGGEATIWTVIEANRAAGRLAYSRVTPGRRAGLVRVNLASLGDGSEISVAYDITALAPEGEPAVAAMEGPGFDAMLAEWRRLILASLGKGD